MKKTLRFAALAAVTCLTLWLPMDGQAQTYGYCSDIAGTSCTGNPTRTYCSCPNWSSSPICGCFDGVWQCGGCPPDADQP